jgi:NAD(P)H-hydrate epimerase
VSLDTPSGLDVTTGATTGSFVTAEVTMTLALPKIGLRDHPAVGRLLLADISVPRTISEPLGGAPEFSLAPILDLS